VLADSVPAANQSTIQLGSLAWVTEEDGRKVSYDFNRMPDSGGLSSTDIFYLAIDDEL